MDTLKDFFLHKLTLRVAYIAGAFAASHAVSLLSSLEVQKVLCQMGVTVVVNDPQLLQTYITGLLLVAGEFIYHFGHNKFVLPNVQGGKSCVSI